MSWSDDHYVSKYYITVLASITHSIGANRRHTVQLRSAASSDLKVVYAINNATQYFTSINTITYNPD